MNIFFLDNDPVKAAKYQCTKHIHKMATECAQILSNVHWRQEGYRGPNHVEDGQGPFKETSMARPTLAPMQWASETLGNYMWAVTHGLALCDEFEARREPGQPRFGTRAVLEWLRDNRPKHLKRPQTDFRVATVKGHEHLFDVPGDPVATARRYYAFAVLCIRDNRSGRHEEGRWPQGQKPEWIESTRSKVPAELRDQILDLLKARKRRPARPR